MMDQYFVIALGDAHGRQDGAGGIGAHQQIDLVDSDQLLVERPSQVRLRLVVLDDPLDLAAKQSAPLVEIVDIDLSNDLVDHRCGGERPGQGQSAANAYGIEIGPGRPEA